MEGRAFKNDPVDHFSEARKLSRYTGVQLRADARFDSRSFSEGWCPGATAITNLSWVQEHLPAGRQESKKCDKQLTHIVRIS
jgi:hypothetical protein